MIAGREVEGYEADEEKRGHGRSSLTLAPRRCLCFMFASVRPCFLDKYWIVWPKPLLSLNYNGMRKAGMPEE